MNLSRLIIDPSTNDPSASRLGLLLINLSVVVISFWMMVIGANPTNLLCGVAATDATVYAFNSGMRVYRDKPYKDEK